MVSAILLTAHAALLVSLIWKYAHVNPACVGGK